MPELRRCEWCREYFAPGQATQRFCKETHKQSARRARKREKERAAEQAALLAAEPSPPEPALVMAEGVPSLEREQNRVFSDFGEVLLHCQQLEADERRQAEENRELGRAYRPRRKWPCW